MSDSKVHRTYVRELPGGGFVAIDVISAQSSFYRRQYYATLVVERRAVGRRDGHSPPEIAKASGHSVESVMNQLLPMAQSNPAIGAALLARKHVITPRFSAAQLAIPAPGNAHRRH